MVPQKKLNIHMRLELSPPRDDLQPTVFEHDFEVTHISIVALRAVFEEAMEGARASFAALGVLLGEVVTPAFGAFITAIDGWVTDQRESVYRDLYAMGLPPWLARWIAYRWPLQLIQWYTEVRDERCCDTES